MFSTAGTYRASRVAVAHAYRCAQLHRCDSRRV